MKFSYQFDANSPKVTVELSPECNLDDALTSFGDFLLAAGYRFEGHVAIVNED